MSRGLGDVYKRQGKLRTVPTDMSAADFEVRATDPYGNVYKCTKLTSYTEREAWR